MITKEDILDYIRAQAGDPTLRDAVLVFVEGAIDEHPELLAKFDDIKKTIEDGLSNAADQAYGHAVDVCNIVASKLTHDPHARAGATMCAKYIAELREEMKAG